MLVDLLGKGFQRFGTAFYFCRRLRTAIGSKGVTGLHPCEVLLQALQVALLVLKLGEGKLPLAAFARYLLPKALGLVDDLLILLVAGSIEAGNSPSVPCITGRISLQYASLAPVLFDALGESLVCRAVGVRERQQAYRLPQ